MVLPESVSSWQNKLPKMAVTSIYVPRVSSSCLLSLWEALQGQQIRLTQAPFKLLLLPWVLECMRYCVHLLRGESLSPTPLSFPESKPQWPSKPNLLGAHLPDAGPPGWGAQCVAQTLCSLGRTSAIVIILLFMGCPRGTGLDCTTFPPLLPFCCGYVFISLVAEYLFC